MELLRKIKEFYFFSRNRIKKIESGKNEEELNSANLNEKNNNEKKNITDDANEKIDIGDKKKHFTFDGYKVENDKEINPVFKKLIMRKIPSGIEDEEELAFCIYNAVNEVLSYDSTYVALEKSEKDSETVQKLLDADISDITIDNRKVICKAWAECYAYFLDLHGIDASVIYRRIDGKETRHKFVGIKANGQVIVADATNIRNTQNDNTHMTDLTRAKLGMRPAGFNGLNAEKFSDKYQLGNAHDKIKEIVGLIDEKEKNEKHTKFMINREMKNKWDKINEEINRTKLDNSAGVQYLMNLCMLFFEDEKVYVNSSLYFQRKDGECTLVPVVIIDNGTEKRNNYKYKILKRKRRERYIKKKTYGNYY